MGFRSGLYAGRSSSSLSDSIHLFFYLHLFVHRDIVMLEEKSARMELRDHFWDWCTWFSAPVSNGCSLNSQTHLLQVCVYVLLATLLVLLHSISLNLSIFLCLIRLLACVMLRLLSKWERTSLISSLKLPCFHLWPSVNSLTASTGADENVISVRTHSPFDHLHLLF